MIFHNSGRDGFDVSTYQDSPNVAGNIDFNKMRLWGADFVIIRSGQNVWIDPDFVLNWRLAREAGLLRGAYWFFDPRVSPQEQARIFSSLFRDDKPEGRLWVDMEFPDSWGGSFVSWQNWKIFIEEVKRITGLRVGVYTANWWWFDHAVKKGADTSYFGQYPLWVAQYATRAEDVILPRGWTSAMIWQDNTPPIGQLVGVESDEIDHDLWNDDFDFATEWGTTPHEETEIPMARYEAVNIYAMSRRPAPSVSNTPLQPGIPAQSRIHGDNLVGTKGSGECWLEITDIGGVPSSGFVAIEHGSTFCSLTEINPPTPATDEIFVDVDVTASVNGKQYHGAVMALQMKPVE